MRLLKKLGLSLLAMTLMLSTPVLAQAASAVASWSPITTNVNGDPVTGVTYNLYRSTAADMSGKTKLNSTTPITSTSFTDTTVTAGTNLYYQVHGVTSSGVEGAGSVIVRFNTNDRLPAVPTGFTVK